MDRWMFFKPNQVMLLPKSTRKWQKCFFVIGRMHVGLTKAQSWKQTARPTHPLPSYDDLQVSQLENYVCSDVKILMSHISIAPTLVRLGRNSAQQEYTFTDIFDFHLMYIEPVNVLI